MFFTVLTFRNNVQLVNGDILRKAAEVSQKLLHLNTYINLFIHILQQFPEFESSIYQFLTIHTNSPSYTLSASLKYQSEVPHGDVTGLTVFHWPSHVSSIGPLVDLGQLANVLLGVGPKVIKEWSGEAILSHPEGFQFNQPTQ